MGRDHVYFFKVSSFHNGAAVLNRGVIWKYFSYAITLLAFNGAAVLDRGVPSSATSKLAGWASFNEAGKPTSDGWNPLDLSVGRISIVPYLSTGANNPSPK